MQTLLNLLAGVSLLVWGTHIVRTGILRLFGSSLRRFLRVSVTKPLHAFFAGAGITALIQSSTATALIVASFAGQGLIGTAQALAVMLGADVGTSIVTVILSFDLSWLSPLLIFVGVVLFLTRQSDSIGRFGRVLIGLGLIMFALQWISVAAKPVVQAAGVQVIFASLTGDVLLDMLVAALLTILVLLESRRRAAGGHAGVAARDRAAGRPRARARSEPRQRHPRHAVDAQVAARSAARDAGKFPVQADRLHPAPAARCPCGVARSPRSASGRRRRSCCSTSLFNVALALVFIFFTAQIARVAERLLPAKPLPDDPAKPRHLDPSALATPTLAISCAAREALRIGDVIEQMLHGMLAVLRTNDRALAERLRKMDDVVDDLYTAVKLYLTQISREALEEEEGRRWADIVSFTINMEQVGDIVERIVIELEDKKIDKGRNFSEAGMAEICDLHARLIANLRLGLSVFLNGDLKSAQELLAQKVLFRDLERAYANSHLARLAENTLDSIETSSLHLDLISDLKRINSHISSIAYPILEQAGVLAKTRLKEPEPVPVRAV